MLAGLCSAVGIRLSLRGCRGQKGTVAGWEMVPIVLLILHIPDE